MCFRGCGGSARELIYPGDRCLRTKNVHFGGSKEGNGQHLYFDRNVEIRLGMKL